MYELLVLALFMHWPLHAYRIAKIARNILGPEEQLSTGTLSTLLAKLEQADLIRPVESGNVPFPTKRSSRAFAITPAGQQRFFALMMDTSSNSSAYRRLFHIKALHLEFLPLEQQLSLIESYLAYCQKLMELKTADARDVTKNPLKQELMSSTFQEAALALIQLKIEQWQLELSWGQALREQIISRLKQQKDDVSSGAAL